MVPGSFENAGRGYCEGIVCYIGTMYCCDGKHTANTYIKTLSPTSKVIPLLNPN